MKVPVLVRVASFGLIVGTGLAPVRKRVAHAYQTYHNVPLTHFRTGASPIGANLTGTMCVGYGRPQGSRRGKLVVYTTAYRYPTGDVNTPFSIQWCVNTARRAPTRRCVDTARGASTYRCVDDGLGPSRPLRSFSPRTRLRPEVHCIGNKAHHELAFTHLRKIGAAIQYVPSSLSITRSRLTRIRST
jgi:hypothetical protein